MKKKGKKRFKRRRKERESSKKESLNGKDYKKQISVHN